MGVALALIASIALSAEPARLEAGGRVSATLSIDAPEDATVELWSSLGTATQPQRTGHGFRAIFTPPKERAPRVALLLATVRLAGRTEHAWLSVPLDAHQPLSFTTRPSSMVEVQIGARTFGPVRSLRDGSAKIPAVVPPGVRTAHVRVRDSFGNVTATEFDLSPPPFARIRLVTSRTDASWTDAAPVDVDVFAVAPSGVPLRAGELEVLADTGTLAPLEPRAPGAFHTRWIAPDQVSAEAATIEAHAGRDASDRVRIVLHRGRAARIELLATPERALPGSQVSVRARAFDARGNLLPDAPALAADFGELRAGTWTIPASFGGRSEASIEARLGEALARASVKLSAAEAASVRIVLPVERAREGEQVEAKVLVADASGNPVSGAALTVEARGADAAAPREVAPGAYAVPLQIKPFSSPLATLSAAAGAARGDLRVPVEAAGAPAAVSIGALVRGQHNFARAASGVTGIEIAARAGLPVVELLGRSELVLYAPDRAPLEAGAQQRASLSGLQLSAGARASIPLAGPWALHVSTLAGALRTYGSVRVQGGPADGVVQGIGSWTYLTSFGLGATLRTGRGRFLVEVQAASAPGNGVLSGNLAGFSLGGGWLASLW